MMFDRHFPLMKALHVDLFSRRHHISSIWASAALVRVVSPTHIMLELSFLRKNTYWTLSVIGSIYKISCNYVWKNMSPEDGRSSHSFVGTPITILHDSSSTFIKVFIFLLHQGIVLRFSLIRFSEWFCILFEIFLCRAFTVSWIVNLFYIIIAGDAIRFWFYYLLSFVSPSSSPVLPRCANISLLLTFWDWYFQLEL